MTPVLKAAWSDSTLRVLLCIAIAVATLTTFHGCSVSSDITKYQSQLEQWKGTAKIAMAQSNRANQLADSLSKINAHLTEQATQKSVQITSSQSSQKKMRQKDDSILKNLRDSLPVVCNQALTLAENYRIEADTLTSALNTAAQRDSLRLLTIKNLTTIKDSLKVSNDSLVKIIKKVPEYKAPKILGLIPLPTRTQAFGVGTVLGILGTVAAVVVLHK